MNPCFAIDVRYTPPAAAKPEQPWPGEIREITVENNHISECPSGISFSKVRGKNTLLGNHVTRPNASASGVSYKIEALPEGPVTLLKNTSTNYSQSAISPAGASRDNSLK